MSTRKPASIPWWCLHCDARGLTTGTESGADKRHADEFQHGTTTSVRDWGTGK